MTLTRTLTITLFLATSLPAYANSYDADALIYLQSGPKTVTAQEATDKLRAAADAHPNLEWHEGAGHEADLMVMLSDVLFGFGTAQLDPAAVNTLASIATDLKGVAGIEIAGHTDSVGSDTANFELALARAEAVQNWLITHAGLTTDQITSVSKGETQPIAANVFENGRDNPEGRSKNRRVAFHILKEEAAQTTEQTLYYVSTTSAL